MAWSTREIAELAGTTVRATLHYHQIGLLDEPVRRANGYKQYGVAHLVRVLRIKRPDHGPDRAHRPAGRSPIVVLTRGLGSDLLRSYR